MPLTFASMQPAHLPGAMRLSADAGWPHREEDWRLVLDISRGFAALQEGEVLPRRAGMPPWSIWWSAMRRCAGGALRVR